MTGLSAGLYRPGIILWLFVFLSLRLTNSAPVYDEDTTQVAEYESESSGCYYNFQHYEEGDRIMTNEPCLNCTCHNRMLMCYLRVCPFTKAIGQNCKVEKRPDQCCPVITCPEVPVQLLTSTTNAPSTDSTEMGFHDNYGCSVDNKFYADGAQLPTAPNNPCELCYCIRNRTTCVMQECTLRVAGCKPVYHPGICCPVKYNCDYEEPLAIETTAAPAPGLIMTTTMAPGITAQCFHEGRIYDDGDLISSTQACQHCYCFRGDIACAVQDCGAPMKTHGKNCTALPPPEGECCPTTYECEDENKLLEGEVQQPVTPDTNDIVPTQATLLDEENGGQKPEEVFPGADNAIPEDHESVTESGNKPSSLSTTTSTTEAVKIEEEPTKNATVPIDNELPTSVTPHENAVPENELKPAEGAEDQKTESPVIAEEITTIIGEVALTEGSPVENIPEEAVTLVPILPSEKPSTPLPARSEDQIPIDGEQPPVIPEEVTTAAPSEEEVVKTTQSVIHDNNEVPKDDGSKHDESTETAAIAEETTTTFNLEKDEETKPGKGIVTEETITEVISTEVSLENKPTDQPITDENSEGQQPIEIDQEPEKMTPEITSDQAPAQITELPEGEMEKETEISPQVPSETSFPPRFPVTKKEDETSVPEVQVTEGYEASEPTGTRLPDNLVTEKPEKIIPTTYHPQLYVPTESKLPIEEQKLEVDQKTEEEQKPELPEIFVTGADVSESTTAILNGIIEHFTEQPTEPKKTEEIPAVKPSESPEELVPAKGLEVSGEQSSEEVSSEVPSDVEKGSTEESSSEVPEEPVTFITSSEPSVEPSTEAPIETVSEEQITREPIFGETSTEKAEEKKPAEEFESMKPTETVEEMIPVTENLPIKPDGSATEASSHDGELVTVTSAPNVEEHVIENEIIVGTEGDNQPDTKPHDADKPTEGSIADEQTKPMEKPVEPSVSGEDEIQQTEKPETPESGFILEEAKPTGESIAAEGQSTEIISKDEEEVHTELPNIKEPTATGSSEKPEEAEGKPSEVEGDIQQTENPLENGKEQTDTPIIDHKTPESTLEGTTISAVIEEENQTPSEQVPTSENKPTEGSAHDEIPTKTDEASGTELPKEQTSGPTITEKTDENITEITEEKPKEPVRSKENSTESVLSEKKPTESAIGEENLTESFIENENPTESTVREEKPTESVASEEKPTESVINEERPTESSIGNENLTESAATDEKPTESVVSEERTTESAVSVEKTTESEVSEEKQTESAVSEEKPTESVNDERTTESVVSEEKPTESIVVEERPTESAVNEENLTESVNSEGRPTESIGNENLTESAVTEEKPTESVISEERPTESSIGNENLTESAVPNEKPTESVISEETPTESVISDKKPTESSIADENSTEFSVKEDKPTETSSSEEKPTESVISDRKPTESTIGDENSTEFSVKEDKPTETASSEEKTTESVASQEKQTESAVIVENPTESSIENENLTESAVSEEKPTGSSLSEEKPTESPVYQEKPTESGANKESPIESNVSEEMPTQPTISENSSLAPSEIPIAVEKPSEPTKIAEPEVSTTIASEYEHETEAPVPAQEPTIQPIPDVSTEFISEESTESYEKKPEKPSENVTEPEISKVVPSAESVTEAGIEQTTVTELEEDSKEQEKPAEMPANEKLPTEPVTVPAQESSESSSNNGGESATDKPSEVLKPDEPADEKITTEEPIDGQKPKEPTDVNIATEASIKEHKPETPTEHNVYPEEPIEEQKPEMPIVDKVSTETPMGEQEPEKSIDEQQPEEPIIPTEKIDGEAQAPVQPVWPADEYTTPEIPSEGNCLINDQSYSNNSNIPPSNPCQLSCRCVNSIVQCDLVQCSPPPSHLFNCMPIHTGLETCCPMYSCEASPTVGLEIDSQIAERHTTAATTEDETKTDSPVKLETPSPGQTIAPEIEEKPSEQPDIHTSVPFTPEEMLPALPTEIPERKVHQPETTTSPKVPAEVEKPIEEQTGGSVMMKESTTDSKIGSSTSAAPEITETVKEQSTESSITPVEGEVEPTKLVTTATPMTSKDEISTTVVPGGQPTEAGLSSTEEEGIALSTEATLVEKPKTNAPALSDSPTQEATTTYLEDGKFEDGQEKPTTQATEAAEVPYESEKENKVPVESEEIPITETQPTGEVFVPPITSSTEEIIVEYETVAPDAETKAPESTDEIPESVTKSSDSPIDEQTSAPITPEVETDSPIVSETAESIPVSTESTLPSSEAGNDDNNEVPTEPTKSEEPAEDPTTISADKLPIESNELPGIEITKTEPEKFPVPSKESSDRIPSIPDKPTDTGEAITESAISEAERPLATDSIISNEIPTTFATPEETKPEAITVPSKESIEPSVVTETQAIPDEQTSKPQVETTEKVSIDHEGVTIASITEANIEEKTNEPTLPVKVQTEMSPEEQTETSNELSVPTETVTVDVETERPLEGSTTLTEKPEIPIEVTKTESEATKKPIDETTVTATEEQTEPAPIKLEEQPEEITEKQPETIPVVVDQKLDEKTEEKPEHVTEGVKIDAETTSAEDKPTEASISSDLTEPSIISQESEKPSEQPSTKIPVAGEIPSSPNVEFPVRVGEEKPEEETKIPATEEPSVSLAPELEIIPEKTEAPIESITNGPVEEMPTEDIVKEQTDTPISEEKPEKEKQTEAPEVAVTEIAQEMTKPSKETSPEVTIADDELTTTVLKDESTESTPTRAPDSSESSTQAGEIPLSPTTTSVEIEKPVEVSSEQPEIPVENPTPEIIQPIETTVKPIETPVTESKLEGTDGEIQQKPVSPEEQEPVEHDQVSSTSAAPSEVQEPVIDDDQQQVQVPVLPDEPEETEGQQPISPIDHEIFPENVTESQTNYTPTTTELSPHSSEEYPDQASTGEDNPHFPVNGGSYLHPDDEYDEDDQTVYGPGTCRYGGKVYVSAQQIPRDDPCDFCFCFRSDIICLQQSCPPPIHGCHEEPINGFCCPRYECHVSMATSVNVTTTTTTTTTTLPPHFLSHAYKGAARRSGCQIKGQAYKVGEVIRSASGPCLHCTCGGDGNMKCDPLVCSPEPMIRQMIAAATAKRRR